MESSPKNSGLESWFERCSELCSSLTSQGCKFSFSLKLEGSFSFSLQSENAVSPRTKKRRSPSYMRRQQRRKADLLKKRSGSSPAEKAAGNHQEEAAAVDTSSPLNLCPKPVYPLLMDIPESEDDYDEEEGHIENVSDSESNQVNDNGEFKITVPCDRCRQFKVTRWWKPPTIWPRPIRCDPCFWELYGDFKLA